MSQGVQIPLVPVFFSFTLRRFEDLRDVLQAPVIKDMCKSVQADVTLAYVIVPVDPAPDGSFSFRHGPAALTGRVLSLDAPLTRIAAQAAKQVIYQKVKEAERENVFEEYKDRIDQIIPRCRVQQVYKNRVLVQVAGNVPDEHVVEFAFQVAGNEGTWNDDFPLSAQAPVLRASGVIVNDSSGGNGDGNANADESTDLSDAIFVLSYLFLGGARLGASAFTVLAGNQAGHVKLFLNALGDFLQRKRDRYTQIAPSLRPGAPA